MKRNDVTDNDVCARLRCAIYKRSACEAQQQPGSLADQERHCREAADQHGWMVADEYIREDAGVSGNTLRRVGLLSLLSNGERTPRPFDVLMVNDASRLGRNITILLEIMRRLEHCGIRLFVVNEPLGSFDLDSLQMLTLLAKAQER
jgi:site-specific DNA recombinase